MEDNVLLRLQSWYFSQCNGNWEHTFGINITTLDNPGWKVEIDLAGSKYVPLLNCNVNRALGLPEDCTHPEYEEINRENGDKDWIICRVESDKFIGAWRSYKIN